MKCTACDKLLTPFESTRKIQRTDGTTDYPDLCNVCFKESGLDKVQGIHVSVRYDLLKEDDFVDDPVE